MSRFRMTIVNVENHKYVLGNGFTIFVLVIRYIKRMRRCVLSSASRLLLPYVSTPSHKGTNFGKKSS